MGQAFSATKPSIILKEEETVVDKDITTEDGKYKFSDGVGKISVAASKEVNVLLELKDEEVSGYQIRYKGYKGMLFIDPSLTQPKVVFRESMAKFESPDEILEICDVTSCKPGYLNRQLITILSGLGISDFVFEQLQDEMIKKFDSILFDPKIAIELCSKDKERWKLLVKLIEKGIYCNEDPFVMGMLQTMRLSALTLLKEKTRVYVPKAANLFGGMDETRTLKYGQVFVKTSEHGVIKGKVLVARSPLFHPGDARVLDAVDIPSLHHMVNAVVFPANGTRPHPSELSGGDLDGDQFLVCWDNRLCKFKNQPPMNYESAEEKQVPKVTLEEISNFFINYIQNDNVGLIATAHTVFADLHDIFHSTCLELAELHSKAIDYAKTGNKAIVLSHLKPQKVPDFMENKSKRSTYKSRKVLGRMYRSVVVPQAAPMLQLQSLKEKIMKNPIFVRKGYEKYYKDAEFLCHEYNFELRSLMSGLNISNEFELFSGLITTKPPESGLFFDTKDFQSKIENLMKVLKNKYFQYLKWDKETEQINSKEESIRKASAFYVSCYTIALEAEKQQQRVLISFGYLGAQYLLEE